MRTIIENIAFKARESEYVDHKSGVSARMSITAYESLVSAVERRMLINNESKGMARVSDLAAIVPAITGKVEMVYEGEQEGPYKVAVSLIIQSIKQVFVDMFPSVVKMRKKDKEASNDMFLEVSDWFANGNSIDIMLNMSEKAFAKKINEIEGLQTVIKSLKATPINPSEVLIFKEFILHGLSSVSKLSRKEVETGYAFSDLFSSMLSGEG